MEIKIKEQNGLFIASVDCKRLTLVCSEEIKSNVKHILEKEGTTLIIDLKGVCFVDSNGIGSLIALAKYAKLSNSRLFFTNIEGGVKNLFNLLHLERVLGVCNNIDDIK